MAEQAEVLGRKGEVIQQFGNYGRLIASADAKKVMDGLGRSSLPPPKGRPVMFADRATAIANNVPDHPTDEEWDAEQARNRCIEVEVNVVPTPFAPMPGFWSAKRFWPAGGCREMVSPAELEELQSEPEHRLRVKVLKDPRTADDKKKSATAAAEGRR